MSKDPLEISSALAIQEKERMERQERLEALAIYVSPLPWFNIDLLNKLYINIFEKYFKNDLEDCVQDSFETRSITCADFIRSTDVRRIDYNAFELDKNKRKILRKKIDNDKKVILEIGRFMIAYSESNHHHFLSPKYREVLNIEGLIIIDPSSAASEISSHISKQLNKNLDGIKMAETAEYYLNIINKKSRDAGIKELKKYLEGKKEWAKGNKDKALEKFTAMQDGSKSNMKTITVKLPKGVRDEIQANFEKQNKEAIIDKVGNGICLVHVNKNKFGNGILLNGGYLLTANHLIKSVKEANNARISFKNKTGDLDSTFEEDGKLDPSSFFLTRTLTHLDFTIVKINSNSIPALSNIPVPILSDKKIASGKKVNAIQITPAKTFKSGEGSIMEISKTRLYHGILLDRGSSGSPVFDNEGKLLAMTVSSNRSEGGARVEAIRIDQIKAELNDAGMDINNLEAKVKSSDLHCILVGNNEYKANTIYSLRGAINDARRMRHFIQSNLNYACLKFIQDATKGEIIEAFEKIGKKLNDGDTLLFYYAGYGGKEFGHFEKQTKFIATSDTFSNQKETNRLSHFELQYLYKQCFDKEVQIVSILDCGYKANSRQETNETSYYRSLQEVLSRRPQESMIYDKKFRPGEVFDYNLISIIVAEEDEDVLERITGGIFMDRFLKIQSGLNLNLPLTKKTKLTSKLKRGEVSLHELERDYNAHNLQTLETKQSMTIFSYSNDSLETIIFKKQFLFGKQLVERRIEVAKENDVLDLSNMNLKEIPESLFEIDHLRDINLGNNKIASGYSRLLVRDNENIPWNRALRRLNKIVALNVEDNPIKEIEELALLLLICKNVKYSDAELSIEGKEFLLDLKKVRPLLFKKFSLKHSQTFSKFLETIPLEINIDIIKIVQDEKASIEQVLEFFRTVLDLYKDLQKKKRKEVVQMIKNIYVPQPDAIIPTELKEQLELIKNLVDDDTDRAILEFEKVHINYKSPITLSALNNLKSEYEILADRFENYYINVNAYNRGKTKINNSILALIGEFQRIFNNNNNNNNSEIKKDWVKISIRNKMREGQNKLKRFVFSTTTGDSTEVEAEHFIDSSVVNSYIQNISRNNRWEREDAQTLFELLIPNEFKERFKNKENILLVVDRETAAYPWEMLQESSPNAKPLSIGTGFIRQLAIDHSRKVIKRANNNRALVIADPQTNGFLAQLPGALEEGKQLHQLLRDRGYKSTSLFNSNASEIITALYRESYSIIHLAGHGAYNANSPHESGIIIGKDQFLTVFQIQQLKVVPDLVFVNCEYSGFTDSNDKRSYQKQNGLAANIGSQLIQIGVKAVITIGGHIEDRAAALFAYKFHDHMLNGYTFGDATKNARDGIYKEYQKETNSWGVYQCYGDPFFSLKGDSSISEVPESLEINLKNESSQSLKESEENEVSDLDTNYGRIKNQINKVLCIAVDPDRTLQSNIEEFIDDLGSYGGAEVGDIEFYSTEVFTSKSLIEALNEPPSIIHFFADIEDGISLRDNSEDPNSPNSPSIQALGNIFGMFSNKIKCVIIHAYDSKKLATSILKHVPFVITCESEHPNDSDIFFSMEFYKGLKRDLDISQAYEFATRSLERNSSNIKEETPILYSKENYYG